MNRLTSSNDVTSPTKLNFDNLLNLSDFTVKFSLMAADDPASLPRILEQFSLRGITPDIIRSHKFNDGKQSVNINISNIDHKTSQVILEKLHAQTLVYYANAEILLSKRLNMI